MKNFDVSGEWKTGVFGVGQTHKRMEALQISAMTVGP